MSLEAMWSSSCYRCDLSQCPISLGSLIYIHPRINKFTWHNRIIYDALSFIYFLILIFYILKIEALKTDIVLKFSNPMNTDEYLYCSIQPLNEQYKFFTKHFPLLIFSFGDSQEFFFAYNQAISFIMPICYNWLQ